MATQMPLIHDISAAVHPLLTRADVPGAAVALTIDGRTVSLGLGSRSPDLIHPLASDSRFYLYSVTKVLLAAATLRLVEQGRLRLDQPIEPFVPDLPLDAPITLRHLLSHTSGLPDYGGIQEYHDDLKTDPTIPWTTETLLARTLPRGLLFRPGEGWAYSNIGFLLVRQVIEQVAGRSLRDVLSDLLFRPVGLQQTTVADSLDDAPVLTPGYSTALSQSGELEDISRRYHPGWVSHGVAISTAEDVARLLEALFGGEVIGPAALAEMVVLRGVVGSHPTLGQIASGLGIFIGAGWKHGHLVGHGGGGPGYSTAAFHARDLAGHRVTAVALANRDRDDIGHELAFTLLDVAARHVGHDRPGETEDSRPSQSHNDAGGDTR